MDFSIRSLRVLFDASAQAQAAPKVQVLVQLEANHPGHGPEVGEDANAELLLALLKDLGFERIKSLEKQQTLAPDTVTAFRLPSLHALLRLRRENHDLGPTGTEDVYMLSLIPLRQTPPRPSYPFEDQLRATIERVLGSKIDVDACVDQVLPLGWTNHRLVYLVERSLPEPKPQLTYGSEQLQMFPPCEQFASIQLERREFSPETTVLWRETAPPRTP